MRASWISAWIALSIALAALFATPAAAQSLTVEVLRVDQLQRERPLSAPTLARWTAATPKDTIRLELPRQPIGHWLRLTVDRDIGAGERRTVSIAGARTYGSLSYYPPGSARRTVISPVQHDQSTLLQLGWDLPLSEGWKHGDAIYLRMQGHISSALSLSLSTRAEMARKHESDRRFAILAYSALLLMTLLVAGLWATTREAVYLYYCGYTVCISCYLLLLSKLIEIPISWGSSAARHDGAAWAAATLATVFQIAFSLRFLELSRWLPRIAAILRAIVWLNLAWLLVLLTAFQTVYMYWYLGGNGLLLATIVLLVYSAVVAWRRGAEYAGYYLLGWTPLMAFAALIAIKTFGLGDIEWAERGLVVAVVLESGVLVLALTQRAAARHRHTLKTRPAPP
ncbi:7TM-DISM domain-containing protein [Lysobacter sp. Root983]|uniref:7TM-DISM domain-containing protein n=1 Tax=Lysobacter sp. Root983 TaxID=1736613 RepID=UPI00070A6B3D|nr:7TM-DISM domain-containing protein [Lysobacter sp. Root983]KRD73599.1 hypothetical protein ASE43_18530 [Lysobacter sp. Root983]